jgi:uroporphyrinogen decarboxylase
MTKKPVLKNDILLKSLRGEDTERPAVWMMRQAGRYLPEYMELRKKYDFFTRVETPEIACEITLQPIRIVKPDAAIIFSDILVIPKAMGLEVQLEEFKGPILPKVIENENDVENLLEDGAENSLDYVYKAISLCVNELNGEVPLIGFAGAPFTILCYMVEGKGSKAFDKARKFCFTKPLLAKKLLQKITNVTIKYLKNQVVAGADCVQIFDSWSGLLSPNDFNHFAMPYLEQIIDALSPLCPVIVFPKGSWYAIENLSKTKASAIGVDWCICPKNARKLAGEKVTLQGNFDPAKLLLPTDEIKKEVINMINDFGHKRYVANLGHGITPDVPVDNARAFIDSVKNYRK